MQPTLMKVGEVAKRTGISVRTLHYYDEIGLLSPSEHTEAGYRLYTAENVVQLQQIMSLRQLGFSLEEIRRCLEQPDFSPYQVIQLHMERIRIQIELQQKLYKQLTAIATHLLLHKRVSVEEFIQIIKATNMLEKYFTPQQREEIMETGRIIGEERKRQVETEWSDLIQLVRCEMDKGTDPASEEVQLLAQRWMALVKEFSGDNPEIEKALSTMYQQEPEICSKTSIDMEMFNYISQAIATHTPSNRVYNP